jgi:hypothetical protein
MRATAEQDELEKTKAEQLAQEAPLFEGVKSISVELGNDQTGDPAMWLIFHLTDNLVTDRDWIKRFQPYARDLQFKIIHSGLTRFPYTRFEQAA